MPKRCHINFSECGQYVRDFLAASKEAIDFLELSEPPKRSNVCLFHYYGQPLRKAICCVSGQSVLAEGFLRKMSFAFMIYGFRRKTLIFR